MAFLRLVVLGGDLRPELDLLDLDLRLVLPGELGLLLLLVPVLAVVHDSGDRWIRLRGDLDEVEILGVRVLACVVRLLDPDLASVLVDESYLRRPDRVVDPGLRDRAVWLDDPPRSQRPFTKLLCPPSQNDKTAASSGPFPRPARLNLRRAHGSGGEEQVRPCLQTSKGSKMPDEVV